MAEVYEINVSELRGFCPKLRAGDKVLLSGYVYTARDAAHKRFDAMLDAIFQVLQCAFPIFHVF